MSLEAQDHGRDALPEGRHASVYIRWRSMDVKRVARGADAIVRKPEDLYGGMVETPGRKRRSRKAEDSANGHSRSPLLAPDDQDGSPNPTPATPNQAADGSARRARAAPPKAKRKDPKVDEDPHFEFGGSPGVLSMMLGFPALMYYMWLGATYYDGHLPLASQGQSLLDFVGQIAGQIYEGAFPSLRAWTIYWSFFIFEALCYLYMPGVYSKGKPLAHEGGNVLDYYCSGVSSFYLTIAAALGLHATGLFKLYTLMDEFGPLMSVAIISGFLVSFAAYLSALYRGKQHRMTGHHVYDFFMGAELNPRMFAWLDFKMFFEVRLPWFILFLTTLGAAARQWEVYGYVTGEVGFLLMAHFLYANACCKGEEMITTTW